MNKPFSPSCERNRAPILDALTPVFEGRGRVIELGSGTGQHAVHFAAAMPGLIWQASDRPEYLPGIQSWLDDAGLDNTPPPLEWDVGQRVWPRGPFDALFSANTLHIMSWAQVQTLFARLPEILSTDARVVMYGPFNYDGQFTSTSNQSFDRLLKARDSRSGIRDFEAVDQLARAIGLRLIGDQEMPANNRLIVWQRKTD